MNEIILGLLAIILQGIFAGSETAFSRANWIRLTTWKKKQTARSFLRSRSQESLTLLLEKERVLIITLIFTNLFVVVASAIFSRFFIIHFGPAYTIIAVIIVVTLSLVIGDFLPKIIAETFPEYWTIIASPLIRLLLRIFPPIPRKTKPEHYPCLSRHDFLYILKEQKIKDSLAINQMAKAIFDFSKMTVAEIMVPKERIIAFSKNADFRNVKKTIEKYRFSRYPVYQKNTDNMVAIVHIKDILMAMRNGYGLSANGYQQGILRKPFFVRETEKAMPVLRAMSRSGEHLGIVQNDKNQTIGIITLEDLIEEVVGEIRSEA